MSRKVMIRLYDKDNSLICSFQRLRLEWDSATSLVMWKGTVFIQNTWDDEIPDDEMYYQEADDIVVLDEEGPKA